MLSICSFVAKFVFPLLYLCFLLDGLAGWQLSGGPYPMYTYMYVCMYEWVCVRVCVPVSTDVYVQLVVYLKELSPHSLQAAPTPTGFSTFSELPERF